MRRRRSSGAAGPGQGAPVHADHLVLDARRGALQPGLADPLAPFAEEGEHIIGVSVSDTRPLAKMAMMIVTENSRKIRPIRPLISTSGKNTAASESVIEMIVKLISRGC